MNPIWGPEIIGTIELEEKQIGNEDGWNSCDVGRDQKIRDGSGYTCAVIDTEEDGGGDEENVVDDKLSGDSRVEGWWTGGGGVELAKGMDEELGWREEEVDGEQAEHSAWGDKTGYDDVEDSYSYQSEWHHQAAWPSVLNLTCWISGRQSRCWWAGGQSLLGQS